MQGCSGITVAQFSHKTVKCTCCILQKEKMTRFQIEPVDGGECDFTDCVG